MQLAVAKAQSVDLLTKKIDNTGNLEVRLVAGRVMEWKIDESERVGKNIDLQVEWRKYQRKKVSSPQSLAEYRKCLRDKGYAWRSVYRPSARYAWQRAYLPSARLQYLLWMKDGHEFDVTKFRNFKTGFIVGKGHAVYFEVRLAYQQEFQEFIYEYRGEDLAIVYATKVMTAPTIDKENYPSGSGCITGGFDEQEADTMVNVLNSRLPCLHLELISSNFIGPTTGKIESIQGSFFVRMEGANLTLREVQDRLGERQAQVYPTGTGFEIILKSEDSTAEVEAQMREIFGNENLTTKRILEVLD